jgi:hypothetical protein
VEVILSIGAVTGGPLLVPSLWALFSKKISGKSTLLITLFTLFINLIFKILIPILTNFKLNRAEEMMLGMGLPILLILINEFLIQREKVQSNDFTNYLADQKVRISQIIPQTKEEEISIKKQNEFGLRVIAGSLAFTSLMIFTLSFFTSQGRNLTMAIAFIIMLLAAIPFYHQRNNKLNN